MALVSITNDSGVLKTTLPSDANTYVTEAFANDWLVQLGLASEEEDGDYSPTSSFSLVSLLVRASKYLDRRFGREFTGKPVSGTQALAWPREEAQDSDGNNVAKTTVPIDILRAVVEYAVEIDKNGGEFLSKAYDNFAAERSRATSTQVGALRTYNRVDFNTFQQPGPRDVDNDPSLLWHRYPHIDEMVYRYTHSRADIQPMSYTVGVIPSYLDDCAIGLTRAGVAKKKKETEDEEDEE